MLLASNSTRVHQPFFAEAKTHDFINTGALEIGHQLELPVSPHGGTSDALHIFGHDAVGEPVD